MILNSIVQSQSYPWPDPREAALLALTLVREDRIFVSDRKLVKLYKLFRIRAWLFAGGTVSRDDLRLLTYLGETHQERHFNFTCQLI